MRLEHRITARAEVDRVWSALLDTERVAACLPTVSLDAVDPCSVTGSVRLSVHPVDFTFHGEARLVERDAESRRIVTEALGRDARGTSTANAVITVRLAAAGATSVIDVVTELGITGGLLQSGRGAIVAAVDSLAAEFAANLTAHLLAGGGADSLADPAQPTGHAESREAAPVDPPAAAMTGADPRIMRGAVAAVMCGLAVLGYLLWSRLRSLRDPVSRVTRT